MATAGNTVHKLQKFAYSSANNTMVHNSDVIVQGNLTVVGTQVYAQTTTLIVKDNIITLNAAINQSGVPLFDAGIEIDRGSEQNVALLWKESEGAWKFTNDGINYETLGGGSAGAYANAAFLQANAAFASANNVAPQVQPAFNTANAAFLQANAAFASANNVAPQVQPAFDKANAAYAFANTTTAWGTRQTFVATAGQTVFNVGSGYLVGYIDVYYNGIKLYGGDDYIANNGLSVTLTNPALVNDIIEVVGFGANVPVANIYVLNSTTSFVNRQTFFATANQTTFTPTQSYRVGYIDVYYNGLKMVIPDDVVANNGTTIEFIGLTPTTNDVIEIVGLTPNVALANAIPITGGSVSGNLLPAATNTYYLGSETQRWKSLYVSSNSIDIDGLVLSNSGGTLAVSSSGGAPSTFIDTFARGQANAAFNSANNVAPQVQPAFDRANAAFAAANSVNVYGANTNVTSFFAIPQGTTAQRPANPQLGSLRYDTTNNFVEVYTNVGWISFGRNNPSVTMVSPSTFNGNAGTQFVVSGGGFDSGAIVTFVTSSLNEYPANTTTYLNSTQLLANTPRNFTVSDEPLSVRVTNPSGASVLGQNLIDCGGSPSFSTPSGSIGTIYDSMRVTSDYSPYLSSVAATDPEVSVTHSISAGSLPTGMTINASTGVLSGNVTAVVSDTTYTFTVSATDGVNTTTRQFSILVKAPVTLIYNTAQTTSWTAPTGLYKLTRAILIGGGGGGSSGNGQWAAGGGGAGFVNVINVSVVPGTSYTLTVAALGAGATSCGSNGGNGANTSAFGNIAYGGRGGLVGPSAGIAGSFLITTGTNSGSANGTNGDASTGDGSGGGGTNGGGSTYGTGATGVSNGNPGNHASGYGNGGGGGHSCQGGHRGGGNGSVGYIEIRY
jgi:hypothetical protein